MVTRQNSRKAERGQVLILFSFFLVALLLFAGMAIDFGMAYVTSAQIGKAADSAALTAARYSALGTAGATALATSAYNMNYNATSLDYDPNAVQPPVITPTVKPAGTLWTVNATATNQTFLIGLLPGFSTLNVAATAQAMARRVEMTLVLDRTGSMLPVGVSAGEDGGCLYLPGSVNDFMGFFDNTYDNVAVVTFADNVAITPPMGIAMTTGNFMSSVTALTASMGSGASCSQSFFGGGTWSEGGMQQALTTETTFTPPAGTNPSKVVVFFTDGNANTVQATPVCTGGGSKVTGGPWLIGGYDQLSQGVLFINPTSLQSQCNINDTNCCTLANGNTGTFPSLEAGGAQTTINWNDVSNVQTGDAAYRVIALANTMRADGITVYSIGLGGAFTAVDQTFLCEVANDPTCSPVYNSALPAGAMEYAATGSGLDQAFQTIASIIRLRLTQ